MATEAHDAAGAAAHGGGEAVGMPQLDITTFPNQIFWLLVTLVVIYLVLTRVALPRIGAVLAERKGTITNDLAAAEELKQKAVQAEKAYNDALAKARGEAARIVAEARASIQADLDVATAKGRRRDFGQGGGIGKAHQRDPRRRAGKRDRSGPRSGARHCRGAGWHGRCGHRHGGRRRPAERVNAMKKLILPLALTASPAMAATGPFFSLGNTNFIVLIAFLIFVGILLYAKVPAKLAGLLDARAVQIKADLDEARALREEAKTILASYERKQKEVQAQSDRIVANAREEAMAAAEQAKADLQASIARRLAAAEDQIASAEASAVREVREKAVAVAIAAAGDVLARQMTQDAAAASIDASIEQVAAKLH
jgi:F-type H+-transporting ATPase subunit b